jgi:hypothetical protein
MQRVTSPTETLWQQLLDGARAEALAAMRDEVAGTTSLPVR